MCGLAGVVRPKGNAFDLIKAEAALRVLAHRGPDAQGVLAWDGGQARTGREPAEVAGAASVLVVHRRLSIIDLTEAARQPMHSPCGRYHVAFNGEIYNYRELAPELSRSGWTYRTASDTEVLLAALATWGLDALPRLVGMFALVLLDTERGTVTLARDAFGIKPLYYAWHDGALVFGSEIPVLFTLADLNRSADPQRLFRFLRWGETDHDGGTLFREVRQMVPGSWIELDARSGAYRGGTYWRPPEQANDISFSEAAAVVRDRFLENVTLHLRSDVPVGAALSGGVDSSAIVCAMRAVSGPALRLHAFSYVADDPAISEERWSGLVAAHAGAERHAVTAQPQELLDDLEHLVSAQGEPFASTRIYAQYRVFRRAREAGITVMLDGQGADELLGGYRYYLGARLADLLAAGDMLAAGRLAYCARRLPGMSVRLLAMYAAAYALPPGLQRIARRLVGREYVPRWLASRWFAERGVRFVTATDSRGSAFRRALAETLTATSLPHLLRYEDRNSMAFSIESRLPFLTIPLADLVLRLPSTYLVDERGTSKAVFRAAMRGLVPDAILDRRDKIGFATPERRWIDVLRPWVETELASETARAIPAFLLPALGAEWQAIQAGRARFDWRVWRWVNVIAWTRRFGVRYE